MMSRILRTRVNYLRTGNTRDKFTALDRYVTWLLKCLLIKRYGRNLHAGREDAWTREWSATHSLRGTVRYPRTA